MLGLSSASAHRSNTQSAASLTTWSPDRRRDMDATAQPHEPVRARAAVATAAAVAVARAGARLLCARGRVGVEGRPVTAREGLGAGRAELRVGPRRRGGAPAHVRAHVAAGGRGTERVEAIWWLLMLLTSGISLPPLHLCASRALARTPSLRSLQHALRSAQRSPGPPPEVRGTGRHGALT